MTKWLLHVLSQSGVFEGSKKSKLLGITVSMNTGFGPCILQTCWSYQVGSGCIWLGFTNLAPHSPNLWVGSGRDVSVWDILCPFIQN